MDINLVEEAGELILQSEMANKQSVGKKPYGQKAVKINDVSTSAKKMTKSFVIGGKHIPFRSNDIAMIFGIPVGQKIMNLNPKKNPRSPFVLRRFWEDGRVARPAIEKHIMIVAKGRKAKDY
ncbi:hypothetical protein L1049_017710 [Liquidambar formosana]|uniref:Uncharacterized protein n=1 Tax=Liquidambar formosana TaxID=63359 RepID=A0AAP0S1B9_LIQFO